ncbi:MAG: Na+/H+ antiporter subunit E [Oscillospiraceae bacterium]
MFVLFFLIWLILNGHIDGEILLFGVLASLAMSWLCYRILGYSSRYDRLFLHKLRWELQYFFGLVWEIILAALAIIKLVYTPKLELKPRLIYFKSKLRSDGAKSALANSITLTAGTITVSVEGDLFCIHALDASLAEGMEDSTFIRRLKRLEE